MDSTNGKGFQVDIRSLESLQCQCGCMLFTKSHEIRKIPALLSPTGKEAIVWIEVGALCIECGAHTMMSELGTPKPQLVNSSITED